MGSVVRKFRHIVMIKRLRGLLDKVAFVSLIADICISTITLLSIDIGRARTVDILFLFNYALTAIVVVSIVLMAYIAVLMHYDKLWGVLRLFRFNE